MQDIDPWVKTIEREVVQAATQGKPLFDPFPLDALSEAISSLFHDSLTLSMGPREEKEEKNFFAGMGKNPLVLSFTLAPLSGDLFWVMSLEDIKTLISWRKDEKEESLELENEELLSGLYRFTLLEALAALSSFDLYKGLSPKMAEKKKLPEHAYSIDIGIKHKKRTLWGRLLLSPLLERSFQNYFIGQKPTLADLQSHKELPIPLTLTAGMVELTKEELRSLEVGDFIRIDTPTYHPHTHKGSLRLYLEDLPLFQIKYKDETYKIFDILYPYQESAL
ncbi:MAG: hypothetical protein JSR76_07095 [Verrucomicrobia bacterium]|nr:hypothetical protein [Verrucomicrobiota bacterium]